MWLIFWLFYVSKNRKRKLYTKAFRTVSMNSSLSHTTRQISGVIQLSFSMFKISHRVWHFTQPYSDYLVFLQCKKGPQSLTVRYAAASCSQRSWKHHQRQWASESAAMGNYPISAEKTRRGFWLLLASRVLVLKSHHLNPNRTQRKVTLSFESKTFWRRFETVLIFPLSSHLLTT